jgi:hypothetical protein
MGSKNDKIWVKNDVKNSLLKVGLKMINKLALYILNFIDSWDQISFMF